MSGAAVDRLPAMDLDLAPDDHDELAAQARRLLDAHRYLTLSTADPSGRPWVSPVYFTPDGYDRLLWVSSPEARHSRNLQARPQVALVVFDSTVLVGHGEAVYVEAAARLVDPADLAASAAAFSARPDDDVRFTADELRAPEPLRLYEAVATECSVLLRGGDPRNLGGVDTRVVVRP